jgi:hypothetical protein
VADREPLLRAILLGASNLRAGLPVVVDSLRRQAAGAIEVLAACGHGRSYGAWSRFLFVRRLPGILGCGLWPALEERPPLRTIALLTDVGNDLVYGVPVAKIAAWIETCLDRLARRQAEIVMTLLPLQRLERLSPWQVKLAAALLFPGRRPPWPGLLEQARELDERLQRMGPERGVRLVEPGTDWYGIDPIHLRRSLRREAWDHIVTHWRLDSRAPDQPPKDRTHIPLLGAAELNLFGLTLRSAQPAKRLADGTTLSLY